MGNGFVRLVLLAMLVLAGFSTAQAQAVDPLEPWLISQNRRATEDLLANIAPPGTTPGVVLASISKQDPNYFFHWVRDASLVMNVVVGMYDETSDPMQKQHFYNLITNFIDFSRGNQLTGNLSGGPGNTGLGEPKFNVDGSPFNGQWARPQNDGAAIRASTLTKFAQILIRNGQGDLVKTRLYDGKIPTETVIKADLEFVAHHWTDKSFDLWEEVKGHHFYTRMVQRKALIDGAALADSLGDGGAADFYRQQIELLQTEILKHWSPERGYILATLDGEGDKFKQKTSNLDVAVILAVLHAPSTDGFFSPTSDMVLATAQHLMDSFRGIYNINKNTKDWDGLPMEPAIGRYPEDTYDGLITNGKGNPWILATGALAEFCFRARNEWNAKGFVQVTNLNQAFLKTMIPELNANPGETISKSDPRFENILNGVKAGGDRFLRRVKFHSNPDGTLSEQLNRDSGYQEGAKKLTWSCSSVLTATSARGN